MRWCRSLFSDRKGVPAHDRAWTVEDNVRVPSAVILSFPDIDAVIGDIRDHLDPSASWGIPAHVSLIYPFARAHRITPELLETVRAVAAGTQPFEVRFDRTGWFGDETVWLGPAPQPALDDVVARCLAAFPQYPPYGGEFDEFVAHLILVTGHPAQEAKDAERAVLPELPISTTAGGLTVVAGAPEPGGFDVVGEYPFAAREGSST